MGGVDLVRDVVEGCERRTDCVCPPFMGRSWGGGEMVLVRGDHRESVTPGRKAMKGGAWIW